MKLLTAEPLITKPMSFDWDPAGRMWVAETPVYPNGRRGIRSDYRGKEWKDHGGIEPTPGEQQRPGRDKISILTSSKGDGVMDTKQVFYEGLELVTGFVFHKDGVIVTQAPDILFIHDAGRQGAQSRKALHRPRARRGFSEDLNALHARHIQIEFRAVGDPCAQDLVVFSPSFVRWSPSWGTPAVAFSSMSESSGDAEFSRRPARSSSVNAHRKSDRSRAARAWVHICRPSRLGRCRRCSRASSSRDSRRG